MSYELHSDLAQLCLPRANREEHRKLAWLNSLCFMFLVVGLIGMRARPIVLKNLPPLEEVIPTVFEPPPPVAPPVNENQPPEEDNNEQADTATIVVVAPANAAVAFSVPTVGNVVMQNAALAPPPPPKPLQQSSGPVIKRIQSTGKGGDFPDPSSYPVRALQERMQGTVDIYFEVEETGTITKIEVKDSSGHPYLDNFCKEWIKKHYVFPPGEKRYHMRSFTFQLK